MLIKGSLQHLMTHTKTSIYEMISEINSAGPRKQWISLWLTEVNTE